MFSSLRQCTSWLHTWTGLIVGWVLFFVFVTGTPGYFQIEITRWMQPELPMVQARALENRAASFELALDRLQKVAPGAAAWRINLPHESLQSRTWQEFGIGWDEMPPDGHDRGPSGSEKLDPATGQVLPSGIEPRATAGGRTLYQMHYLLHYMDFDWGIRIVGVCTMLMLMAIVTGVITHKKIFKDFFTFRPGKGQRSWLDAHNAVSVMALPFFLMITYSGLVFFLFTYMPAGINAIYGSDQQSRKPYFAEIFPEFNRKPVAISRPETPLLPLVAQAEAVWGPGQVRTIGVMHNQGAGEVQTVTLTRVNGSALDFQRPQTLRFDARSGAPLAPEPKTGGAARTTQTVMLNLHEGLFVGAWGRWVYFMAGLLGCAMIGTGMVLWTVKRRRHHLGSGLEATEQFGVRLVETLNVATIAGLPMAVAAYFLANRLLPLDITDRPAWEVHTLFAVWLGALFYALARPLHRAWIELFWAGCAAYALVPVINALTTDKHLLNTLRAGDWVLAGFDLTMWGMAALLALMAVKVKRRLDPARAARKAAGAAAALPVTEGSVA